MRVPPARAGGDKPHTRSGGRGTGRAGPHTRGLTHAGPGEHRATNQAVRKRASARIHPATRARGFAQRVVTFTPMNHAVQTVMNPACAASQSVPHGARRARGDEPAYTADRESPVRHAPHARG